MTDVNKLCRAVKNGMRRPAAIRNETGMNESRFDVALSIALANDFVQIVKGKIHPGIQMKFYDEVEYNGYADTADGGDDVETEETDDIPETD